MSGQKTRHQKLNSYLVMNSLGDKNMSTQQRSFHLRPYYYQLCQLITFPYHVISTSTFVYSFLTVLSDDDTII